MQIQIGMPVGFRTESGSALSGPTAPTCVFDGGSEDGEIDITVSALPASWGDLTTAGDGLGALGKLQWWNALDGWQDLISPAATGDYTVSVDGAFWGYAIPIKVRGVSFAGRAGRTVFDTVTIPGGPMVESPLTALISSITYSVTYDGDQMTALVPA